MVMVCMAPCSQWRAADSLIWAKWRPTAPGCYTGLHTDAPGAAPGHVIAREDDPMYARRFRFRSSPAHRPAIEEIADAMYAACQALPGFEGAIYLVSEDQCEYSSLTLWTTREEADAAGVALHNAMGGRLEGIATEGPEAATLEVYPPREP
jgi:heme-degrading monooxygenase HmoA